MGEKVTKAQREFLQLALRSPDGNPWRLIGMGQRGGGAKARMFSIMQERGLFGRDNIITDLGRQALKDAPK